MFIKRQPNNQYTKSTKWSRANEPIWNKEIEDKYIHYPNMYELYQRFSEIFDIPINNFILTSGCEESLTISLQVLKDYIKLKENGNLDYTTELVCESPTWGLAELIMNQYADKRNIFKKRKFVEYDRDIIHENEYNLIKQNVDYNISYITSDFNGLFLHTSNIVLDNKLETYQDNKIIDCGLSNIKYESFEIIDEVYHLSSLRKELKPWLKYSFDYSSRTKDDLLPKNYKKIYIGSFSKIFGAGFRLGYIYYNGIFDNLMKYYRPQYISSSAVDLINILYDDNKHKNIFYKFDEAMGKCIFKTRQFRQNNLKYYSEHPNFISVDEYSLKNRFSLLQLDDYHIDKKFKLNNTDMVRLCRPIDFTIKDI